METPCGAGGLDEEEEGVMAAAAFCGSPSQH